ncbi:MAG: hypothetical protein LAT65_05700 [Saccharospirillum sp.]|nr:hypothetical protein [Saccharospirillum sp.]
MLEHWASKVMKQRTLGDRRIMLKGLPKKFSEEVKQRVSELWQKRRKATPAGGGANNTRSR